VDLRELASTGAEPTALVLQPVIVSLLERSGRGLSRHQLIQAIDEEWSDAGGTPTEGRTLARVKKALSALHEQGIVESPVLGFYCLTDSDSAVSATETVESDSALVSSGSDDLIEEPEVEIPIDRFVGGGKQFVYAFYLPTFRAAAEAKGESRWPVKIGMTTTSVEQRMASHQTALPEVPEMAILIRTDNAALMERVIHGILTMRGRRMDESAGSEWFSTNDDELTEIFEWLTNETNQ
jgi:hypothetical protein